MHVEHKKRNAMKKHPKRYHHIYSLTMADIDLQNRMSPMAVLNYFQDAIGRFLAEARVSALDLLEEGATWMITEFHATFADELPSWPGIVSMEVYLSELSTVKAYVDYLIRDVRGNIVVRGTSAWVMMELASRRMIPCRSCQRFVEQYDESNHTPHARYVFPPLQPASGHLSGTHAITQMNTDFNGHVSNREYFRISLSLADLQKKKNHRLRDIHIKFLQETRIGESLRCYQHETGPGSLFVQLVKAETGAIVCQLMMQWES